MRRRLSRKYPLSAPTRTTTSLETSNPVSSLCSAQNGDRRSERAEEGRVSAMEASPNGGCPDIGKPITEGDEERSWRAEAKWLEENYPSDFGAPKAARRAAHSLPGPPTLDERESSAPVILADALRGSEPTAAGELEQESDDSVPVTASSSSDTASQSPKPNVDSQPSWWWKKFFGVPDSICVSPLDAELCVRLVVGELLGLDRVLTINCEFEGDSVSLREMYHAIGRISGNNHGWTTVQELWLRARKREGIQPNRGVPVLPFAVTQASAPWLKEDGTRRQLEADGAWAG
jgi:putative hemolysin